MSEQFIRTEMLLGREAVLKLARVRVAVFGVGGVGGYAVEAMARSGIKAFDLIDNDVVSISNINRQIIALHSTVGRYKTEVMKERILDISPDADVREHRMFFLPGMEDSLPFDEYDYVVDAVDTVAAKTAVIVKAKELSVPVISAMGAGNKLEGTDFRTADIYETKYCPLARAMRRELKARGVNSLKVVYSEEIRRPDGSGGGERTPGSVIFATAVAGLLLGAEVVKDIIKET